MKHAKTCLHHLTFYEGTNIEKVTTNLPCIWTRNSVLILLADSLSFSLLEPHKESTSSTKMMAGLLSRAISKSCFTSLQAKTNKKKNSLLYECCRQWVWSMYFIAFAFECKCDKLKCMTSLKCIWWFAYIRDVLQCSTAISSWVKNCAVIWAKSSQFWGAPLASWRIIILIHQ